MLSLQWHDQTPCVASPWIWPIFMVVLLHGALRELHHRRGEQEACEWDRFQPRARSGDRCEAASSTQLFSSPENRIITEHRANFISSLLASFFLCIKWEAVQVMLHIVTCIKTETVRPPRTLVKNKFRLSHLIFSASLSSTPGHFLSRVLY